MPRYIYLNYLNIIVILNKWYQIQKEVAFTYLVTSKWKPFFMVIIAWANDEILSDIEPQTNHYSNNHKWIIDPFYPFIMYK